MASHSIEHIDGVFCARFGDSLVVPIRLGGAPVTAFLPGWSPERLVTGDRSLNFLSLTHRGGGRAIWYLNGELDRICDKFSQLPGPQRAKTQEIWQRVAEDVWQGLFCRIDPTLSDQTAALVSGSWGLREDLIRNQVIQLPGAARVIILSEVRQDGASGKLGHDGVAELDPKHLLELFHTDFLQCQIEAARSGKLSLPSPVDGRPLAATASLNLTGQSYAYRFADTEHGIPFHVFAADWRFRIWCVYFPSLNLVIYEHPHQKHLVEQLFLHTTPEQSLFRHAFMYADALSGYLKNEPPQPVICYSYYHLGHHLWNELTGIHAVLQKVPAASLPQIFVAQPQRTEMYGKLDELFPQLGGRIDRSIASTDELTTVLYGKRYLHLRPTGARVTRDLANHIMEFGEHLPDLVEDRGRFERLRSTGCRIITLGLRVENRTVVDFPQFCVDLVSLLREEFGRIVVIVDGHNSAAGDDSAYKSHEQHLATQDPITVERQIVLRLQTQFSADPDLSIVSTVGESMAVSIFWCRRSEFFVTPWGAGLAKYRWICNLPGLVISNRHRLLEPSDELHLYDSPAYIEEPAPIWFIGPEAVEDVPDAELLVPDRRGRANFRVDMAAIREQVHEIVQVTAGTPPAELFAVKFSADGDGHLYQRSGWNAPEAYHTWTEGAGSNIIIPAPRNLKDCMLELEVAGLTFPPKLDFQELQIAINGIDVGTFYVGPPRTIRCRIPWLGTQAVSTLNITFKHPNCARPSDFGGRDQRCTAIRFSALRVCRAI